VVEKVCLDSNILIEILNNNQDIRRKIEESNDEYYITPVSIFEVWYGRKDTEKITNLLQGIYKLEFDEESAKIAAKILKQLEEKGKALDARDMFIGAICIKNKIKLMTLNKKHFERLKEYGLELTE